MEAELRQCLRERPSHPEQVEGGDSKALYPEGELLKDEI